MALCFSYFEKERVYGEYESARNEVIFSVSGIELNKSFEFQVDYMYAHGIIARNAERAEDENDADLTFRAKGGKMIYLMYSQGTEFILSGHEDQLVMYN